jgi:hypothetical protein
VTREEYMDGELSKWRSMWEGDHPFALFGAVQACVVAEYPLPEWAALALLNLIAEHHFNPPPRAPRGGSRYTKKTRDDLEHWKRWNAVQMLRRQRVPWEKVYEEAALSLYGRIDAKGGRPSAIKASYLLVEKAREVKDPSFSFSVIDPSQLPG